MILKYNNGDGQIQYADLGKNFIFDTSVIESAIVITFYRVEKGLYQIQMIDVVAEMNLDSKVDYDTVASDDQYFYEFILPAVEDETKDMIEDALRDGVVIMNIGQLKERASAVMTTLGKYYLKHPGEPKSTE